MANVKTTPAAGANTLQNNTQAAAAAAQSADENCQFCGRVGLPILPLRYAAIPTYLTAKDVVAPNTLPQLGKKLATRKLAGHRYVLRTLRKGYVMVYHGSGLWDAYAVTEGGHLRKLPSLDEPDNKSERELTPHCKSQGHNIPASFIHITPITQGSKRVLPEKIWVAFSEALWTATVRKSFEGMSANTKSRRDTRMQAFSTAGLGKQADTIDDAFQLSPFISTATAQRLSSQVFEYADDASAATSRQNYRATDPYDAKKSNTIVWNGAHGVSMRPGEALALAERVKETTPSNGQALMASAVVLNDPLGIVQELNATRLHVLEGRQKYLSDPRIARPLAISQSIMGLKKLIEQQSYATVEAQDKAKNLPDVQTHYIPGMANPYGIPTQPTQYTDTRQERADAKARPIWKDLEEHYREADRKAFEDKCIATLKNFAYWLPLTSADYACWLDDPEWVACRRDFDPDDPAQQDQLIESFAAALLGGPTSNPQESNPDPGNADESKVYEVWKKYIQQRPDAETNPIYVAIYGDQKDILEAILPEGANPTEDKLNKGTKLYKVIKTIISSKNLTETRVTDPANGQKSYVSTEKNPVLAGATSALAKSRVPKAANAAAAVVAALGGALARLSGKALTAAHEFTVVRAIQGAILLYERREIYLVTTQMKVGEYVRYLESIAFQSKLVVARQMNKAGTRIVRSICTSSIKSISDPKLANAMIEVTTMAFDEVEKAANIEFDKQAKQFASKQADKAVQASAVMAAAKVHPFALSPGAAEFVQRFNTRLRATGAQSAHLLKELTTRSIRMTGTGKGMIAIGNFVLQAWSLKDNIKKADTPLLGGNEARLAVVAASMGFAAAVGETVGLGAQIGSVTTWAKGLSKVASVVGAAASFVEGIQMGLASIRTGRRGDLDAAVLYGLSSAAFIAAGAIGTYAAIAGASALFGPVGWVLGLIAIGVIAAYAAMKAEDSIAAIWLDRCYWGKGSRYANAHNPLDKPWTDKEHSDELAQLNAIVVGMKAETGFNDDGWGMTDFKWDTVKAKITLPLFNTQNSAYTWRLTAVNGSKYMVIGEGTYGTLPENVSPAYIPRGKPMSGPSYLQNQTGPTYNLEGSNKDMMVINLSAEVRVKHFRELALMVDYVPDLSDPEERAIVELSERD